MAIRIFGGLMLLLLGTSLGAAAVFVLKGELKKSINRALEGFAAGVMVAASVWSLLIPAIEGSNALGQLAFLPAAAGLWLGFAFLMLIEHYAKRLEGGETNRNRMMIFAVTLHNIPEGMAVGVAYAALRAGNRGITEAAVLTLAAGIAIQNIPEGAIISMPLRAEGKSRSRAFLTGVISGAVEPVAGCLTVILAGLIAPLMPIFLSFAAGAMLYVVIEELIPECATSSDCTQEQYFLQ